MAMYCPNCNQSHDQRLHCPECGEHLLYRHGDRGPSWLGFSWARTPWVTLAVGLVIAQELYFALHQLEAAGVVGAVQRGSTFVWATLLNLLFLQASEAVSVFAAGVFTGAAQRRGVILGAAVGAWSGLSFILIQQWCGQRSASVAIFFEPILQAAFGGLGGLVGSFIWRPGGAPPLVAKAPARLTSPFRREPRPFSGPIAWGRVLGGVTVAVSGLVWADAIREFVLQTGRGVLTVDTTLEAHLMTWEISALAILAGGALAGATVSNSLSQGLWVGLATGIIIFCFRLVNSGLSFELVAMTVVSSLSLALVGSWFGGHLFPSAQPTVRRNPLLAIG